VFLVLVIFFGLYGYWASLGLYWAVTSKIEKFNLLNIFKLVTVGGFQVGPRFPSFLAQNILNLKDRNSNLKNRIVLNTPSSI
jgi:hypothetical protein